MFPPCGLIFPSCIPLPKHLTLPPDVVLRGVKGPCLSGIKLVTAFWADCSAALWVCHSALFLINSFLNLIYDCYHCWKKSPLVTGQTGGRIPLTPLILWDSHHSYCLKNEKFDSCSEKRKKSQRSPSNVPPFTDDTASVMWLPWLNPSVNKGSGWVHIRERNVRE